MQHELKSNNFVEGKSGWRMSKDGTFEVCYRAPFDKIEVRYKKAPGMEAEVTYSGISRSQQEEERDFAVRNGYITEAMISEAGVDPVASFRERTLGKPFHRELDRAILSGQDIVDPQKFTASIKAPELGRRTGRMDEIPPNGFKPGSVLKEFRNDTAARVANATESLEQLISHNNRMILEMEKIEGGSIDLLILASNNMRMSEALLREMLRKLDTREVDDGK